MKNKLLDMWHSYLEHDSTNIPLHEYPIKQHALQRRASVRECLRTHDRPIFLERYRIQAALEHPNILPVYDIHNNAVIVHCSRNDTTLQEYMEHVDVQEDSDRIISVLLSICEALAFTHEQGIIHRAVHPQSIIVRPDGAVWLDRWHCTSEYGETAQNWNIISAEHCPPEILRHDPATPASDVFQMACLLWWLHTKQFPFTRPTLEETLDAAWDNAWPQPQYDDPFLTNLLQRAGHTDPKQRGSIEDFAEDLRAWQQHLRLGGRAAANDVHAQEQLQLARQANYKRNQTNHSTTIAAHGQLKYAAYRAALVACANSITLYPTAERKQRQHTIREEFIKTALESDDIHIAGLLLKQHNNDELLQTYTQAYTRQKRHSYHLESVRWQTITLACILSAIVLAWPAYMWNEQRQLHSERLRVAQNYRQQAEGIHATTSAEATKQITLLEGAQALQQQNQLLSQQLADAHINYAILAARRGWTKTARIQQALAGEHARPEDLARIDRQIEAHEEMDRRVHQQRVDHIHSLCTASTPLTFREANIYAARWSQWEWHQHTRAENRYTLIKELLSSPNASLRWLGCRLLGLHPETVHHCLPLLHDSNTRVAKEALRRLITLQPPKCRSSVIEWMQQHPQQTIAWTTNADNLWDE